MLLVICIEGPGNGVCYLMKAKNIKKSIVLLFMNLGLLWGCGLDEEELVMTLPDSENVALSGCEEEALSEDGVSDNQESSDMYVYICGAVVTPGVYELEEGSRLYEAVDKAGGLTDEADETSLNLARELSDGEQIVVLTAEQAAKSEEEQQKAAETSGLVNINTATAAELTAISGIGESRAQAIIAYREKNGGFSCIEDIKKVDGIKDGLFSKIKDKITV
jgi:competence protein ComEA